MSQIPLLRRLLLPILVLATGVGGFALLKATRPVPPQPEARERVWRVQVQAVSPADLRPILTLFGRVEVPDRVRAAAPVAGRLLELSVRDGEQVAAGQLLARLDPRDLEPRLAQARAEVEREQLKVSHDRKALEQEQQLLKLAEAAASRAEQVKVQNLASQASVDQAREQLARARLALTLREQSIKEHPARLAVLEAKLAEAERDAARGVVTAPFPARIGKVEAAPGDQLQPNQTILTLYPLEGLYLRAKVPVARAGELRSALAAGEQLAARGSFAGRALTARLERLSGEADARGVDALLRLAPAGDTPPGAFLELKLERPAAAGAVALPFAALHGGDRVFTVRDGRLAAVAIERLGELEAPAGSLALVRSPELKAGTPVMVTHLPNAVEGLKVETLP